jgi:hypothetical protein|eukprot:COSAG01_NODE_12455_length_1735_cov_8.316015_1_plen_132_part_00
MPYGTDNDGRNARSYAAFCWDPQEPTRVITEPTCPLKFFCPALAVVGANDPWDDVGQIFMAFFCGWLYTLLCWEPTGSWPGKVAPGGYVRRLLLQCVPRVPNFPNSCRDVGYRAGRLLLKRRASSVNLIER